MRRVSTLTVLALSALALACGPADTDPPGGDQRSDTPGPLELIGEWADGYGMSWTITKDAWGTDAIVAYDNDANFAITHQPATDAYNPNKFAKLVWTEPKADGWWYCMVDFGLDTADAAKATPKTAAASDPATRGCGGFPWTHMALRLQVSGDWVDNYGGSWSLTNEKWGTDKLVKFDNAKRFAITQAPADAQYSPNKFSKWVWTAPTADGFWACSVDFGRDTAADAENTNKVADASDPATKGCGGFPWSHFTRAPPPFELIGSWNDNYGGSAEITQTKWGTSSISSYDNDTNTAILQSPADDQYSPNKFSKWVWTEPKDGSFWTCTVDFGLDTADAAKASTKTADATNPAEGGCGGFPWTKMTKKP